MYRFRHHPLLGTVLEVRVVASDDVSRAVDDVVVREVVRLERIFSAFAHRGTTPGTDRHRAPVPA